MKLIILLTVLSMSQVGLARNKVNRHDVKNAKAISLIIKAADKAGVPRELLLAICFVESSYRLKLKPKKDGDTPSYGICQVKLETAQTLDRRYHHRVKATPERLSDPFVSAFYGAKLLRYQLRRYRGDWRKAVEAYNKGYAVSNGKGVYVNRVHRTLLASGYWFDRGEK